MIEEEQEMETILMAGSALSTDFWKDKAEALNPTQ